MSAGKIASQAGHAYLGAAINTQPEILKEYHLDMPSSPGTKVCLRSKSLDALLNAEQAAKSAGISTFMVTDSGCHDFFNGRPTVTALGVGPATRDQVPFLRKFQLLTNL